MNETNRCTWVKIKSPLKYQPCGWKWSRSWLFGLLISLHLFVSVLVQREDGAAMDGWRRLQDHLLCDEWKPASVLGLRFNTDPNRCGHPAAGPLLQPRHTDQAGLNADTTQVCYTAGQQKSLWGKPKSNVLSILVTSVEQASPAFRCTQAIKCSLEQIAYTKSALPLNY